MKVIYVDDERLAQNNFKYYAERIVEIDVLSCLSNATHAIASSKQHKYDIAFLDCQLPARGCLHLVKSFL